ncbi:retinoid-inducible serine carboxypeptidase-like [Gigantopelta aegis]|uniref:retinoid-inducible serine carboxypeptidase-like n=1 Tax=Gigantopelta aegis TaxID=1735272 RepID=UPI001B8889F1|nr:retinoid-inducible serine carboxypeptidase-like [Gigantopelta aegis]
MTTNRFSLLCFLFGIVTSHTYKTEHKAESVRHGVQDEEWAYVNVRPSAHMFYWLYKTTSAAGYKNAPLVMWLQGGPGGSSTGFGNFGEIGPLDVKLNARNNTWLSVASLLFVDNPVGAGYSYVDKPSAYTSNVDQIAKDLLTLFISFMKHTPDFQKVPFYIFSESYGGKMTAAFSQVLYSAIQRGELNCDFRGLAMGDSWISPVDSTLSWSHYLYVNSLVDQAGRELVNASASKTAMYVHQEDWVKATAEWATTEDVVEMTTYGVNFYNILKWGAPENVRLAHRQDLSIIEKLYARHVAPFQNDDLSALMNGPIREKLKIIPKNVTWGGQSGEVFQHQQMDFMKPVTQIVNDLIENTPLSVVVYSGQLDLIVDTFGTEAWVYRLKVADEFRKAKRDDMKVGVINNGYVKKTKNFSFYWILSAGHMVPADNGPAALDMLMRITKSK